MFLVILNFFRQNMVISCLEKNPASQNNDFKNVNGFIFIFCKTIQFLFFKQNLNLMIIS